jgi:hypothetical protein
VKLAQRAATPEKYSAVTCNATPPSKTRLSHSRATFFKPLSAWKNISMPLTASSRKAPAVTGVAHSRLMFMMHLPGVDIAVQRKRQRCRGKAHLPEITCHDGSLRWGSAAAAHERFSGS